MSISRVKPGDWTYPSDYDLTAAEIAGVDSNFFSALDKRSGQTDTAYSTVDWTAGGLSMAGAGQEITLSVNSSLTVSSSSGEINLYGSGGSLGNSIFPAISGGTVSLSVALGISDCRQSAGGTYGATRLWSIASTGTIAPYIYFVSNDEPDEYSLIWRLPRIHGSTLVSVSVYLDGVIATSLLGTTSMPNLEVTKITRSTGAAASLKSGVPFVYDTSTSSATFTVRHPITLTADQNNTSQTLANGDDFVARLSAPPQTSLFLRVYGLVANYQVTRFAPAL